VPVQLMFYCTTTLMMSKQMCSHRYVLWTSWRLLFDTPSNAHI